MSKVWIEGVSIPAMAPPDVEDFLAPAYIELIRGLRQIGIEYMTDDFIRMGCTVEAFEWLLFHWDEAEFDPPQMRVLLNDWRAAMRLRRENGEP